MQTDSRDEQRITVVRPSRRPSGPPQDEDS
jgi:hypothetical protein